MSRSEKIFLQTLNNQKTPRVPFWFMRQAGRYLPEYRELRATAGGFLNLVYNPDWASEITIQPIRRFNMDAAILFSDILVIPQALGQELRFEIGEGPKLNPVKTVKDLEKLNLENIDKILSPIYETIRLTREKLSKEGFDHTALIGFAGSPWTVACYMVEGGGSKNFQSVKKWANAEPEEFQKLIDILVEATSHYLIKQINAGAEAIQLFDSWAGLLEGFDFERWIIQPTQKTINHVKDKYPDIPVIGFPRNAGEKTILYAKKTGISVIGLDYELSPSWIKDNLQSILPVQGNLDPEILLAGGTALEKSALGILETLSDKSFVFNLGHGVIKETPPEHVGQLASIIRNFER